MVGDGTNTGDLPEEDRDDAGAGDLPETWNQTERHPRLPDGSLGTFETEQGTCFYDRDHPGRYIVGQALEIGEYE